MSEHIYTRTWEATDHLDNVIGSADLRFHFTYAPGLPGDWYNPPEGPEIEIHKVEERTGDGYKQVGDKKTPIGESWSDYWIEWAMDDLYGELIRAAENDLQADAEQRADYAYEAHRDRMLERD